MKNPPKFSRRKTLLFYGIMALVGFMFMEISLQLFYFISAKGSFLWERSTRNFYELDPIRGFRIKPNLSYRFNTNEFQTMVYTDSQGFRSSKNNVMVPIKKPKHRKRLLHLGNSFTFGWGLNYQETYPALLNESLNRDGHDVDFLNAGIPGQSPSNQFCWLKKVGHSYEADLIVVMRYSALSEGTLWHLPFTDLNTPLIDPCSRVPNYVIKDGYLISYHFDWQSGVVEEEDTANKIDRKPVPLFHRILPLLIKLKNSAMVFYSFHAYNGLLRIFQHYNQDYDALFDNTIIPHTPYDRSLHLIVNSYKKFLDYAKNVNGPETKVLFLYIPPSYVVHREDIPRWTGYHKLKGLTNPENIDILVHNNQIIVQALRSTGIRIIDMTPFLINKAKNKRVYYWLDAHLTPAGAQVVSQVLSKEVKEIFSW